MFKDAIGNQTADILWSFICTLTNSLVFGRLLLIEQTEGKTDIKKHNVMFDK